MKIKKVGKKKWSLNFHDQPKSQNPTCCFFFFKSKLSVSSWSIPALTTIKENNSSYLCTVHLQCSKHLLQFNIWLVILIDYNPVHYTKAEILVYHENLVTISVILSIEFFLVWQRN